MCRARAVLAGGGYYFFFLRPPDDACCYLSFIPHFIAFNSSYPALHDLPSICLSSETHSPAAAVVVACLGLPPPTNPVLLEVAEQQEEDYSVQPRTPRSPRAVVDYSARRRTTSRGLMAQEEVCLAQHRIPNNRLPVEEEDSSVRRKTSSLRLEVEGCLVLVRQRSRVVERHLEGDCSGLRLRRTNSPLQAVDCSDRPRHKTNRQVGACLGLRRRRINHQVVVYSVEEG